MADYELQPQVFSKDDGRDPEDGEDLFEYNLPVDAPRTWDVSIGGMTANPMHVEVLISGIKWRREMQQNKVPKTNKTEISYRGVLPITFTLGMRALTSEGLTWCYDVLKKLVQVPSKATAVSVRYIGLDFYNPSGFVAEDIDGPSYESDGGVRFSASMIEFAEVVKDNSSASAASPAASPAVGGADKEIDEAVGPAAEQFADNANIPKDPSSDANLGDPND